ncbi:LppM family (lipo)protein [Actinomyces wuliandei]|uniref:LppM family (lipo)protein n=1 Tax=Actinomyces wuliandei TaxID=2057743 RepID=UPI000FDAE446|nr:hypothetical protein [Actinomyces wuliandei]
MNRSAVPSLSPRSSGRSPGGSRAPGLVPMAALLVGLLALVGSWLLSPPAAGAEDDTHVDMTVTLHEEEAVDIALLFAREGATTSETEDGCDPADFEEESEEVSGTMSVEVAELDGMPACSVRFTGLRLRDVEDLFNDSITVRHADSVYEVVLDEGFFSSADQARLTVRFPGGVDSASGAGEIDGSTATWADATSEDRIRVTGGDSEGLPWLLPALVGGGVLLAAVAGVVVFLVVRRRRTAAPTQPAAGYGVPAPGAPGASTYPVPGQLQAPTQPQGGYAAQPQASYPQGPQAPQMPYAPEQGQASGQVPPVGYAPGQGQAPVGPQPPAQPGQAPGQGTHPPQDPGVPQ